MRLLSTRQAAGRLSVSVSTLKRLAAQGTFPAKVKISAGRIGYVEAEIDRWIEGRATARDIQSST